MADRQPPRANASNPIPIPGSDSPPSPQHHPPRDCYFPQELIAKAKAKAIAKAKAKAKDEAAAAVESQPNSGPSSPGNIGGAEPDDLPMSPEPSQPGSPSRIPDGMYLHPLIDPRPAQRIRENLENNQNILSCSHSANVASSAVGVSSNVTVESSSVGVSSNVAVASSFSSGGRELTSDESNKTSESGKQRVEVKQTEAKDGDKASESDKRRDGDQLGKASHS